MPELRDNPSVDLSQLTLRVTENGEYTQTLTLARGDKDCKDGFWLKPQGDVIVFCPSLCQFIADKRWEADLTLEFQFSCL